MLYLVCLIADSVHPILVAVAKAVCADAGAKVDILFSVLANSRLTMTAFHNKTYSAIGLHNVFVELFYGVHFYHSFQYVLIFYINCVPIPSLESSSISIECGTLPSMIVVFLTPRLTASTQQSIFGIIPPLMMPFFLR